MLTCTASFKGAWDQYLPADKVLFYGMFRSSFRGRLARSSHQNHAGSFALPQNQRHCRGTVPAISNCPAGPINQEVAPMPIKRHVAANGTCRAKTKAGRPCAAPAVRGGAFCSLHADPERAAALGRKGGARNRKVYDDGGVCNVSVPESAGDVKRMLAETMADIRARKMDPKLGSTLGYLGMSLLKAFEVADLEQRLERLEHKNELEEQTEQTGTTEAKGHH